MKEMKAMVASDMKLNSFNKLFESPPLTPLTVIQGDQKVSAHLMITVQKTRKNILNTFNHLP
jgi:hypothetical protein